MLYRDRQTSPEGDLSSKPISAISRDEAKDTSAPSLDTSGGVKLVLTQMNPQPGKAQARRLQLARRLDSQEALGAVNPRDCWLGQKCALIKSCSGTPVNSSDESAADTTTCNQVHK